MRFVLHRVEAGIATPIFAYSGRVDGLVVRRVLDHAHRLCAALPGDWSAELVTTLAEAALPWSLIRRFGTTDAPRRCARRSRVPHIADAHGGRPPCGRALAQPSRLLH